MTTTAAHRRKTLATNGAPSQVRVAAYCRRSVEKAAPEFGSIEAQREAIASYVASQKGRGWHLLPTLYEDRNISGATTDRPALRQLVADAQAGQLDVVCLYKFDRISRRLIDFLDLIRRLEECDVAVVSITQAIDTGTPTGRLMLNILASFGEFEREQIAERISDKMAASRRKGIWQGGRPPLGLDVVKQRLEVNEAEAAVARDIFASYLRLQSITVTLDELARRGIRNKAWTTKDGRPSGGSAFDTNSLRSLLANPLLVGKMRAGDAIVTAGHAVVVPTDTFDAVQALLGESRVERRHEYRPSGALLQGLLRCGRCQAALVPHYTQKGTRRFGYYVCSTQKRRGSGACTGTRAPAGDVEAFVVERIREIGKDPGLVLQVVTAARAEIDTQAAERTTDLGRLGTEAARLRREHERLVQAVAQGGPASLVARVAVAEQAADEAQSRFDAARAELAALKACAIDEADLRKALGSFAVWDELFPTERQRILHLLIERVVYDASAGSVDITFRPGGVAELAR